MGARFSLIHNLNIKSLAFTWAARTDGDFLPSSPRELVSQGIIANVPVVIGACDDEGTILGLTSLNISTTDQLRDYLSNYFFLNASRSDIDGLLAAYSEDLAQGSPFNTGTHNAATPQFKRISALLGDLMFDAPRRLFLEARAGKQDIWAFVNKRGKDIPILGAAHVTDLFHMFGPSDITDHLIHFVNYLDPNGPAAVLRNSPESFDIPQAQDVISVGSVRWPKYDPYHKAMLAYLDGSTPVRLVQDVERDDQLRHMVEFLQKNWIR